MADTPSPLPKDNPRLARVLLLVLCVASVYLFAQKPAGVSGVTALSALVLIWLGAAPALLYLSDRNAAPFPFLPLTGIFYALAYGFPVFSGTRSELARLGAGTVTTGAVLLVACGVACLYLTFSIAKWLLGENIRPLRLPRDYDERTLRLLACALIIAHLCEVYWPSLASIPSVFQMLDLGNYVGYGILLFLWIRKRLPLGYVFLVFGVCLPLELAFRLATGALMLVVLFGLFLQLIMWYARRRISWTLILATVLFFVLLQPVKFLFRTYTWEYGRFANLGTFAKVRLFADVAIDYYSGALGISGVPMVEDSAVDRIAHIRLFSYVMSQTPSPVPYWHGATYVPLFTKLIPRFFWRGKPTELRGQDFGHRYGLIAPTDFLTSMNLPWVVELYANFGAWGVPLGMAAIGVFFAFLNQLLNQRGMTFLEFVIGSTILFPVSVNQESNFSLVCGNVILGTLFLYVFFRFSLGLYKSPKRIGDVRLRPDRLTATPTRSLGAATYPPA